MSFPKVLLVFAVVVFSVVGLVALFKGEGKETPVATLPKPERVAAAPAAPVVAADVALPDADRMDELFNLGLPKLPIVETVTFSPRVPWKKGQAAWVSDYAGHYHTSRHFIARSLNGGPEYEKQNVSNGDRFNVFKADKPLSFHLVVDTSRCKLWFYYLDEELDERVLLKTYDVGLGRSQPRLASGLLTPHGTYTLGDKISVYHPGKVGLYNNEKIEMLNVFGTRWIPFGDELEGCTSPAKGFGLHGCPWTHDELAGTWAEDASGIGGYESDGCIRLKTQDIEELFAVVITKPTTIYLVDDFFKAELPGKTVVE